MFKLNYLRSRFKRLVANKAVTHPLIQMEFVSITLAFKLHVDVVYILWMVCLMFGPTSVWPILSVWC